MIGLPHDDARALWHINLHSGRRTRSPRYMTRDADVASADALIGASLRADPPSDVVLPSRPGHAARISPQGSALLVTLSAPVGGVPTPLVAFGVAIRDKGSARLWRRLHGQEEPPADPPWCAVRDEAVLGHLPETARWLPDWQLSVAWAWLERRSR